MNKKKGYNIPYFNTCFLNKKALHQIQNHLFKNKMKLLAFLFLSWIFPSSSSPSSGIYSDGSPCPIIQILSQFYPDTVFFSKKSGLNWDKVEKTTF